MHYFRVCLLVIFASFTFGIAVQAQPFVGEWTGNFALPGVTGPVYALAEQEGRLYVGGNFAYAGSETAFNVGVYNTSEEMWASLGGGINGAVFALAVGPDGVLYAGGQFSAAGGTPAANVAMYDPITGAWASMSDGIDGFDVRVLVFGPDGLLYAGGEFDMAGGVAAKNLARWDGAEWETVGDVGSGFSYVEALAFRDGSLYVGGNFEVAGGIVTRNVARYDLDSGTWSGLGGGVDADVLGEVQAIVANEEGIFVGGTLDEAIQPDGSSSPINNVAQWDPEEEVWSALGGGGDKLLSALAFGPDGMLYATGVWDVGEVEVELLRRWNGQAWEAVDLGPATPQARASISTLLTVGGRLFMGHGGVFLFEGPNPKSFLYWYEPATEAAGVLGGPQTNGFTSRIRSLATDTDGTAYAGGGFHFAGDRQIDFIAQWDGAAWDPLGGSTSGSVLSLEAHSNGRIYVGGFFQRVTQTDGTVLTVNRVVSWDSEDEEWYPVGGGVGGGVRVMVEAPDGTLYVGGDFDTVEQADGDTLVVERLARWEPEMETWETVPSGHGIEFVRALASDVSGTLYAAGSYVVDETLERRGRVARLDLETDTWTTLREWPFASVRELVVVGDPASGGALYVGTYSYGVWQWKGSTWTGIGGPEFVYSLARNGNPEAGGELYAGGVNGNSSGPYVQRWNGEGWSGLGSGLTGYVSPPIPYALAVGEAEEEGKAALWVGGEFIAAGRQPSSCIARWVTEDFDTSTEDGGTTPQALRLEAYPNPASRRVTFRYHLAAPGPVRLALYDVLGREVATLVDSVQPSGTHEVAFERSGLASGVYVVRIEAGGEAQVLTQRVTVMR